jgi:hypothetical protein
MNSLEVSLIKYSESFDTKKRLATFAIRIPKFVWGHIISHRVLSRNSASSRAVPTKRIRGSVIRNPFLPVYFGENKAGMQSGKPLKNMRLLAAKKIWLWSRYVPSAFHYFGEKIGMHKEVINRILEPWLTIDVIVSGTEWNNFILLRTNEDAQPEIRFIAEEIDRLLSETKPVVLKTGEWHIPFIMGNEESLDVDIKKKISVARCARVSYKLFDGKVSNIEGDIKLCAKLSSSGHWSPFEHVAQAQAAESRLGNFVGWKQYRKEFQDESRGDYGSH